ncbi:hypothetical protein C6P45_002256 [Maudiozyma exigua]|uniref:Uncharacterized protein n=1 Tax=Maudiozyma exigua TaxID=34358 RepID=A0A9P6WFK3_MAUEX|nr:hypothetical protein C6P45_002256 [Kazachstania exigua]
MLRKRSKNHGDTSKRHSMFLETMTQSFNIHQEKPVRGSHISDPIPINTTSRVPVRLSKREHSARTTTSSSSDTHLEVLKRSSMVLDGNLIRDYNIAIKSLNSEQYNTNNVVNERHLRNNGTRSDSESSLTSNGSTNSSLFSNNNSINLHDLLNEELENNDFDNIAKEPIINGSKALFVINDNVRDQGKWLDPKTDLDHIISLSNEESPILDGEKSTRTILEFI